MKKEFIESQIIIISLDNEDIIKTSGEVSWWPTKGAAGGPDDRK